MATAVEFPLLLGNQEPFQDQAFRYPLSFSFSDGSSAPLFTAGVVSSPALERIALSTVEQIATRHMGQRLLLVQVLEGARLFFRMLIPHLEHLCPAAGIDYEIGSLKVRSYSHGSRAASHQILQPLQDSRGQELNNCSGFDGVILIDDLIDAGHTMAWLITEYLPCFTVNRIGVSTMLSKSRSRTNTVNEILSRHLISAGMQVPNDWLVGYGLDMALPGDGETQTLHLFRQALPGGVYAFNSNIEERLVREYQQRPAWVAEQLSAYICTE